MASASLSWASCALGDVGLEVGAEDELGSGRGAGVGRGSGDGRLVISNREVGLAILAFSSTLANTAETTWAGVCVLLNAVVLKVSSYSRPPANRVAATGAGLGRLAAAGAAAAAIGLPSP